MIYLQVPRRAPEGPAGLLPAEGEVTLARSVATASIFCLPPLYVSELKNAMPQARGRRFRADLRGSFWVPCIFF